MPNGGGDNADLLTRSIDSAKEGDGVVKSSVTILPSARQRVVSQQVRKTPLPDVRGNLVRILSDCDPLQFLIDVVNGKAIEHHIVTEDNQVVTVHSTPNMNQRISCAKYLTNKYLPNAPRLSVHHHKLDEPDAEGSMGGRSFTQIVTHAASRDSSD